jgi:hypothetical protein
MPNDPVVGDLARRVIDYGLTPDDLGPRQYGTEARSPRRDLKLTFPASLAPTPVELDVEPATSDPLPRADVLVVTWTVAEMLALADVLTPKVNPRTRWYRYDRKFEEYLPNIRNGAPSRMANRLGSYYPTKIGSTKVLCVKSELHLNQDGVRTGPGTATLPVAEFVRQMLGEVKPKLVITAGTAGATLDDSELGDVMITRSAKFRCSQEFENEDFNGEEYHSPMRIRHSHIDTAKQLMAVHASRLQEPALGPPTKRYDFTGPLVPGPTNTPNMQIDGTDFPRNHPILTTDYFEFGTSSNGLDQEGCGVEMGDAVFGLVAKELGNKAPKWLVVRNASDPQINGDLPGDDDPVDMQAHWAVWYYETYGYWTSVMSSIATWAMIA